MLNPYRCRHGVMMHFDTDKTIGESLRLYGEWAEAEIFLISQYVHTGDTALDIGSNVGCHSLAMSRMVGESGRVISIDAQHKIFQIHCANMILNRSYNVECINALVGCSNSVEYVTYDAFSEDKNCGARSYVNRDNQNDKKRVPIAMIKVDSLNLNQCKFIKIDVEGMELDVLLGAVSTIRKHKPYLYFEQNSPRNFSVIYEFLVRLGYQLRWHVANPFNVHNFNNCSSNIFGGSCETNVFAAPVGSSLSDTTHSSTVEILDSNYNPPIIPDAIAGWLLPEDAYASLEGRNMLTATDAHIKPLAQDDVNDLRAKLAAMTEDRIKAQGIIEHLDDKISRIYRDDMR